MMKAGWRHGRDVAAKSRNGGGAEEPSDGYDASEFIFIPGDDRLADGGIADVGRCSSHADGRCHFTGGIDGRP